jgi:hypothetical protein
MHGQKDGEKNKNGLLARQVPASQAQQVLMPIKAGEIMQERARSERMIAQQIVRLKFPMRMMAMIAMLWVSGPLCSHDKKCTTTL